MIDGTDIHLPWALSVKARSDRVWRECEKVVLSVVCVAACSVALVLCLEKDLGFLRKPEQC